MKFIDEYRNKELVEKLVSQINRFDKNPYIFMEVCGSHTMAIQKFGIPSLLPENINLISGPGCPVCVTAKKYIDTAIAYSKIPGVIIATYGDLMRVPGSHSSLEKERSESEDIRIVYSSLDAVQIAGNNPEKKVVFLGIGFETTAPGTAVAVKEAEKQGMSNFFVFSAHKLMPPAMNAVVDEGVRISGYICPGHVSAITGKSIYEHIPRRYGLPCVISGFEPSDILQSILMLIQQIEDNRPAVEIQYKRVVKPEGNPRAQAFLNDVFTTRTDYWRGLGAIPDSGLKLKKKYKNFDIEEVMPVEVNTHEDDKSCICGEVLKGLKNPLDCKLFGKYCNPLNPVGACMVSLEGACQAYYKYQRNGR